MQFSFHLETAAFDADGNILQWGVITGEDFGVQNIGQRLRVQAHLGSNNVKRERVLVVKDGRPSGRGWNQLTAKTQNVHGHVVREVIHHIAHLHLDRARFVFGLGLVLRDGRE